MDLDSSAFIADIFFCRISPHRVYMAARTGRNLHSDEAYFYARINVFWMNTSYFESG